VVSFRGYVWLLVALVPVYLVLAAVVPPADDELYYWCWAERLQWSYYDHPPMTAYLIRLSTAVLGNTLLAVRLPAVVSTLTVLLVVGWLSRPRTLLPLVVFTPLFTFGAVLVTPDTPLLMFWALYLLWLVKVHKRLDGESPGPAGPGLEQSTPPFWLWALGGVVLGCGILGKYTTGLAVIGGFLSFLFATNWRRWAAGYAVHLGVAFLVSLPILIHNVRHDFAPLRYQWAHSMGSPRPGLEPFFSFLGIQLLLFGALPFAVFAWALRTRRELLADPRLRACFWLFVFPFAFFLYKATRGPLEGNWALACYIAVWPLAAAWYARWQTGARRYLFHATFAVPAACVLLLAVHLVRPVPFISPRADRITRQASKIEVAREVAAALRRMRVTEPVYVPSYQWTALLRFHGIDARQIDGVTRPSHFTQCGEHPTDRDRALVFTDEFVPEEQVRGFGPPHPVGVFPLVVRGELIGGYWLLEYAKADGPGGRTAAAGRPRLDQPAPPASP
jgi:4-amino-4-deoxy-L-arabinose transferase-like glycosyltransferase